MNVELKFKPGVRTSLNSNNNIRDSFGSDKNKPGVSATRNSAASSATQNLSQMSLVSGNWNSKSGSILNNNAPTRSMNNSATVTTYKKAGTINGRPTQNSQIDPSYVSAGRTQHYVRDKYSGFTDYGFSREILETGNSGRSIQRQKEAAYDQGNPYAQLNKTQQGADIASITTSFVSLAKVVVENKDEIWGLFSSKDSKASGNVDGNGNAKGTVSETASKNIKSMKDAKDSVTLGKAIDEANTDSETTKTSINTMKDSLAKAEADKSGLETAFTEAQTSFNSLDKQVKAQQEIINQNTATLSTANTSYESAKKAYENAPAEPTDVKDQLKTAMDVAKAKLDEIQGKIDEANKQLETLQPQLTEAKGKMDDAKEALDNNQKVIDETPAKIKDAEATVAAYEKGIGDAKKNLDKMQKSEDKEFAKLANKSDSKISDKDKTKRSELAQTIASRSSEDDNTFEEINGNTFAKITDKDGNTRYLVNGEMKTEAEFNTEMDQAKNQPTIAQDTTIDRYDDISGINFA